MVDAKPYIALLDVTIGNSKKGFIVSVPEGEDAAADAEKGGKVCQGQDGGQGVATESGVVISVLFNFAI